jgi:NAD(P)-dependent dehydrogenase (short-subunit alcohol dehydrogenase family)
MADKRLAGKVAIVTGGSRGIGAAIARRLAAEGAKVVVNYAASKAAAEEVVAAIKAAGGEAVAVKADVGNPAEIPGLFAACKKQFGRLDILVNNAGIMVEEDDANPEHEMQIIRDTMQTNVYGSLFLSRLATPIMKSRRYGRIVNLSSGMGSLTEMGAGYIAYRMSKAALNVVTRVLAAETEGMGILINSVDPGWVKTGMGGRTASRSVEKGAETPVWLATLPDTGPSGGFFRDRKPVAW